MALFGFISYAAIILIDIALIVAAFQTSTRMGVLTLIVPVYAASFGNYRLKTEHRRTLAVAWWIALIVWTVLIVSSDR